MADALTDIRIDAESELDDLVLEATNGATWIEDGKRVVNVHSTGAHPIENGAPTLIHEGETYRIRATNASTGKVTYKNLRYKGLSEDGRVPHPLVFKA
jgi:hypothetical protein